MSWAALNEQLVALLPRLALPTDPAAVQTLTDGVMVVGTLLKGLQGSATARTAAEA